MIRYTPEHHRKSDAVVPGLTVTQGRWRSPMRENSWIVKASERSPCDIVLVYQTYHVEQPFPFLSCLFVWLVLWRAVSLKFSGIGLTIGWRSWSTKPSFTMVTGLNLHDVTYPSSSFKNVEAKVLSKSVMASSYHQMWLLKDSERRSRHLHAFQRA